MVGSRRPSPVKKQPIGSVQQTPLVSQHGLGPQPVLHHGPPRQPVPPQAQPPPKRQPQPAKPHAPAPLAPSRKRPSPDVQVIKPEEGEDDPFSTPPQPPSNNHAPGPRPTDPHPARTRGSSRPAGSVKDEVQAKPRPNENGTSSPNKRVKLEPGHSPAFNFAIQLDTISAENERLKTELVDARAKEAQYKQELNDYKVKLTQKYNQAIQKCVVVEGELAELRQTYNQLQPKWDMMQHATNLHHDLEQVKASGSKFLNPEGQLWLERNEQTKLQHLTELTKQADHQQEVVTFLRERLSTKSAELDKAQKRVSELEQIVLKVDQSIDKTSKVSDVQSVHIDKLARTTKESLALADALLAHGLKFDQLSSELFQARASGEQAKKALLDTEDNLVQLKAELAGLKKQAKAAEARVVEEEDKVAGGLAREQALKQEVAGAMAETVKVQTSLNRKEGMYKDQISLLKQRNEDDCAQAARAAKLADDRHSDQLKQLTRQAEDDRHSAIAKVERDLDQANARAEHLKYELERSEGKLVHAQADSTEARSWVARLEEQIKSHNTDYDSFQQRSKKTQDRLEGDLIDEKAKLARAEGGWAEEKGKAAAQTAQLVAQAEVITQLEAKLKRVEEVAEADRGASQASLAAAEDSHKAEVERLSSEKGALEVQLAEAMSAIAAGQAEAVEQNTKVEQLRAELRASVQATEKQARAVEAEAEARDRKHQNELNVVQQQVATEAAAAAPLRKQVEALASDKNVALEQLSAQQAKTTQAEAERSSARARVGTLEAQVAAFQGERATDLSAIEGEVDAVLGSLVGAREAAEARKAASEAARTRVVAKEEDEGVAAEG